MSLDFCHRLHQKSNTLGLILRVVKKKKKKYCKLITIESQVHGVQRAGLTYFWPLWFGLAIVLMVSREAHVPFQMLVSSWGQNMLFSSYHLKTLLLPKPEFYRIKAFYLMVSTLVNGFIN